MAREPWAELDEIRLKRMYDHCPECDSVVNFFLKLHALLALKSKSIKSVEWKIRRMGLDPKVSDIEIRPERCDVCKKKIRSVDVLINGKHKKCYNSEWYVKNYKDGVQKVRPTECPSCHCKISLKDPICGGKHKRCYNLDWHNSKRDKNEV